MSNKDFRLDLGILDGQEPRVLLIDEGFIGSVHTAVGLVQAGLNVVLLGAVGGSHRCQAAGVIAELCSVPSAPQFTAEVLAVAKRHGCNVLYPCTESTMLRLWRDGVVCFPVLTEAQRSLLASKARVSRFVHNRGVAIPDQVVFEEQPSGCLDDAIKQLGMPLMGGSSFSRSIHVLGDRLVLPALRVLIYSHLWRTYFAEIL